MNLNIINKQSIHPIIIPILYFKDIYNQDNSFFEMNPSLHINEKGNVVILIRNIDYRIFDENKFTIYNHPTNSIYMIMTGSIIKNEKIDIEKFTLEKIDYNYDLPILQKHRFINTYDTNPDRLIIQKWIGLTREYYIAKELNEPKLLMGVSDKIEDLLNIIYKQFMFTFER